jgi:hypothetical protein
MSDAAEEVYRQLEQLMHTLGEMGVTGVVLAAETSDGVVAILEDGSPAACVQLARAAHIKLQTHFDLGLRDEIDYITVTEDDDDELM